MGEKTRLDEVTVFDIKLRFLIPRQWQELETAKENFYLYSKPSDDSAWFRVSLNTCGATRESLSEIINRIFLGRENVRQNESTGNWVCSYKRDTVEDAVNTGLYYWIVAKVVQPELVREAVFSYTVLSERVEEVVTKEMLSLLEQIVSKADFGFQGSSC
jgi:hypothetical protein